MRKTILVGSNTGGQGATLAVEVLTFATYLMKDTLFSYTAEYCQSHDVETSPPRGRPPWPKNIKLPINGGSYAWWDEFGEVIAFGSVIVDCEPKILSGLLDWAKDSEPKMRCSIWLLVTATSDPKAIEGAIDILNRSFAMNALFPVARRIFLYNACNGLPDFSANAPGHRLMSMVKSGSCEYVGLLRCESKLLSLARTRSISLENLLKMELLELHEMFGLTMPELVIENRKLQSWFSNQMGIFQMAGLVPERGN